MNSKLVFLGIFSLAGSWIEQWMIYLKKKRKEKERKKKTLPHYLSSFIIQYKYIKEKWWYYKTSSPFARETETETEKKCQKKKKKPLKLLKWKQKFPSKSCTKFKYYSMERQRGQVKCLLSNHLERQALWKKCLQDNSLTSSSASNPQRQTQHSAITHLEAESFSVPPLKLCSKDLNWVIEILLSLPFSQSNSSSELEEFPLALIICITDLTKFFKNAIDITVFITKTGNSNTPSAEGGKFERPILEKTSKFELFFIPC